jgi:alanine racemase
MTPRPTRAEIDLGALVHNYRALAARAAPRETLAVVKADAYGHGAVRCARALEAAGAAWLGVALVEEGIELREAGARARIVVLNGLFDGQADACLAHDLTPVVYRVDSLRQLDSAAARAGRAARAHLKIDTGMGRVGVPDADLGAFAGELKRFEHVEIEGALTHLADADLADPAYSNNQVRRFEAALAVLRAAGARPRLVHFANSAAVATALPGEASLARPGILLYGAPPAAGFDSRFEPRPVMRFVTETIFVKRVPPGTPVSYGRTFVTKRESVIATLPVGYADGYSRKLGNRGEVLARGRRLPIVGRVCMDLTMIDATDVSPGLEPGEEVVLFGEQEGARIPVEEVAGWAETIDYEVLCAVSRRVPRVYREP